MQRARSVGRPKGVNYPLAIRVYENEEGVRLLNALANERGVSTAALVRRLVREEARRTGLIRSRWAEAAERLQDYYETSSEVSEWQAVEDGYVEATPESQAVQASDLPSQK
jgi:hypothetical protein